MWRRRQWRRRRREWRPKEAKYSPNIHTNTQTIHSLLVAVFLWIMYDCTRYNYVIVLLRVYYSRMAWGETWQKYADYIHMLSPNGASYIRPYAQDLRNNLYYTYRETNDFFFFLQWELDREKSPRSTFPSFSKSKKLLLDYYFHYFNKIVRFNWIALLKIFSIDCSNNNNNKSLFGFKILVRAIEICKFFGVHREEII